MIVVKEIVTSVVIAVSFLHRFSGVTEVKDDSSGHRAGIHSIGGEKKRSWPSVFVSRIALGASGERLILCSAIVYKAEESGQLVMANLTALMSHLFPDYDHTGLGAPKSESQRTCMSESLRTPSATLGQEALDIPELDDLIKLWSDLRRNVKFQNQCI